MTPEQEAECLHVDPFEGDFGGAGDADGVLSDKMVTARKGGPCHLCAGECIPKTRVRRRVEVYDGSLMTFSWCAECCEAMVASIDFDPCADAGEFFDAEGNELKPCSEDDVRSPYEVREDLGRDRREAAKDAA